MKTLAILFLLIKCISGEPRVDPIVQTSKGLIRGLPTDDGGDYNMFLGIPYAVVDENNPFGPSTPHPGFNTIFDAYEDGVRCPQVNENVAMGTLQCLQLNVYVPKSASSTNKLPVMVFQHGGSFVVGEKGRTSFSPKFLVKHDVIMVTLNYRVGVYGFLCLSEPGYNNQGLKDQLLAMQWIKDNIAAFGGDDNKITVFGQSAGAMTLDILLLTKENLANRAIIQSGTALTTWVIATQNDTIPINVAKKLGSEGEDVKSAIEFLKQKDFMEVIQAAADLQIMDFNGHAFTRPCVETVGDDALLTDFPINLKPKVKGMDLMIGHTNKEVMFLYPNSDEEWYANYKFSDELVKGFNKVYDEDIIKHFYVGDQEMSIDLHDVILDFGSDFVFFHPTEETVQRYLEAEANRVYRYVFSYEGGRNRNKILKNLTSDGAAHSDDLGYIFDMSMFEGQTPNEEDQRMIDIMTTMWTNFAKYGNPTPTTSDLITVEWLQSELKKRPYLSIDKNLALGYRPFYERMAFWDVYYKLYRNDVKGFKQN